MKFKIVGTGGYSFMQDIEFPIVVEAKCKNDGYSIIVESEELIKNGANQNCFNSNEWVFTNGIGVHISRVADDATTFKLVSDGGYDFLAHLDFPVKVVGYIDVEDDLFVVMPDELVRIGAKDKPDDGVYAARDWLFTGNEVDF